MTTLTVGIDPGMTGALAILNSDNQLIAIHDLPFIGKRLNAALLQTLLLEHNGQRHAWVEESQSFPGQGVSSAFNYGTGYGTILGVLAATQIPYRTVRPAIWKKAMQLGRDKTDSRRRATELWPAHADQFQRVKDDGRAEAALIALYGAAQ